MSNPTFQFRGVWIPAEILLLFQEKKITASEMTFLSIVEGLSEARGKGCWASNRYLAEMMGCHASTIKDYVRRLRDLGLIKSVVGDGRRTLWTSWGDATAEAVPGGVRGSTGSGTGRLLLRNKLDNIDDNGSLSDGVVSVATFRAKPKNEKHLAIDEEIAKDLHQTIVEVRKILRPWSLSKWIDSIRLLRKDLQNDEVRLRRVFEWWKSNVKRKGLPTITNADQFRKHFAWIEDHCEKEIGKLVEIDEETKAIAKRVVMLGWPGISRPMVPITIQITKNNLDEITHKVWKTIQQNSNPTYTLFLRHVRSKLGDARTFSEQWLRMLHERYAHWREWNQDLASQALTLDHPLFQKMGRGWASSYAADTRLWDRLIGDIRTCK